MEPPGENPSSNGSREASSSQANPQSEVAPPPPTDDEHQGWDVHGNIGVDTDDSDSAIGGFSDMSSTTSAKASVFGSVDYVDGRKYHRYRQGKYMMPNDEVEQERLNMQHQLWLMTLDNKLSFAPLKEEPLRVLDIGTGTGVWAVEYALEHPTTVVLGSDLSPIQPDFVPVNCSFEVDDLEDEWIYTQRFDLIHGRAMLSCLADPKRTFEQAFKHLAPGGFLEMQDADMPGICDDNSMANTSLQTWYDKSIEGAKIVGRDVTVVKRYKKWMEEVGFEDVEEKLFYWPVGTWPKDPHLKKLGFWWQQDLLELIDSFKQPFIRGFGWTLEQVEELQAKAVEDVHNRSIHCYHVIRVVIGKKPEL